MYNCLLLTIGGLHSQVSVKNIVQYRFIKKKMIKTKMIYRVYIPTILKGYKMTDNNADQIKLDQWMKSQNDTDFIKLKLVNWLFPLVHAGSELYSFMHDLR